MYKIVFFIGLVLSFSCATNRSESEQEDENFSSFLKKYINDTSFQMSHTDFPLTVESYSSNLSNDDVTKSNIEKKNWKPIFLDISDSCKFSIDTSLHDTVKVVYSGVDNGVYVTYFFLNRQNNGWKLIRIFDESN